MPPRKKPTKNRINMRDIIAQPLAVLPDAVDAILKRPEELDSVEIGSIFHETSYILLRAEEALSIRDERAFCALFKLLSEGFAHSEASFEEGIMMVVLHGPLLQAIHNIFRTAVEREALPLHGTGTVELIQVISNLCDGEALKENCGALFMSGLSNLLTRVYGDREDAKRHFHVQRGIATALINLVKGSKHNKLRLPSWKFIADCCAASVDAFFQLQCIELLFRVSRQKKTALAQLGDVLSPAFVEKLGALPNDGTLLSRMSCLVDELHAEQSNVLKFNLLQMSAAETLLTKSTSAYFTPFYLVVMVTSGNADNITIPYRFIRSVTLGKDGRIIIKLEEFPVKLDMLLSHTAGMDTVTLHMTADSLKTFKGSSIRTWIVSILGERQNTLGGKRCSTGDPEPPQDQLLQLSGPSASAIATVATGVPLHRTESDNIHKKFRVENPHSPTSSIPVGPEGPQGGGGTSKVLVDLIDTVADQCSTQKEASAVLSHLKRIIDAKIEVSRSEAVTALNDIMTDIQEKVDACRRDAEESRSIWRQAISSDIGVLEEHIEETQSLATAGVEQLNEDLRKVKQSNHAINERIACIEVELQRGLEESREMEALDLRRLRAAVGKEVQRQEQELDQRLLNRTNPSVLFSGYLRAGPLKY